MPFCWKYLGSDWLFALACVVPVAPSSIVPFQHKTGSFLVVPYIHHALGWKEQLAPGALVVDHLLGVIPDPIDRYVIVVFDADCGSLWDEAAAAAVVFLVLVLGMVLAASFDVDSPFEAIDRPVR